MKCKMCGETECCGASMGRENAQLKNAGAQLLAEMAELKLALKELEEGE